MDPPPVWSNIVKKPPPPPPPQQQPPPVPRTAGLQVPWLKSGEGISTAVVDANAVIEGGDRLNGLADRFVTVPEVLSEIRDPVSRHRLSFIPFSIHPMDPTPDSLSKVVKFARATGDLQTLSDVDLKLIALTYTLEAQAHGAAHLRDAPPPVHTVNVKRLPEKDLPGWGNNVPNLEEWEALEREEENEGVNGSSRILPVKDISLNVDEGAGEIRGNENDGAALHKEGSEDGENSGRRNRRYPPKKREVKIEGKKMVAEGVDASKGEFGDDAGDWLPAVSRSTHRRYLRRKARREQYEASLVKDTDNGDNGSEVADVINENHSKDNGVVGLENSGGADVSQNLEQMRLEESTLPAVQDGKCEKNALVEVEGKEELVGGEAGNMNEELEHLEISSQTNESFDTSNLDDDAGDGDSEQSWMLRSLSESSVACVTSDFAMQNVLLQMGLRLLAPGGNQIRQLHRWVLKCHACFTVTADVGRIFCPKCGNGGTLRKVAVTVGENGVILAGRKPRITLRGTKFSLPLPKGGRDAITKNPIVREDQLPQKFLYPKTKKKANKEGDEFFAVDNMFSHHTDKNAPFQPPVRKAVAVFSGKRNPNDNHYSRSRR